MRAFCRVFPMRVSPMLLARPALAPSLGITAPAVQAADMPVPAPAYYPPVPPAIYDWTGIYVGGHIGGGILWIRSAKTAFRRADLTWQAQATSDPPA